MNSDTSAPAANAFSLPVTTTAFTDGVGGERVACAAISSSSAVDSGLSGGRLSRSSATPSGRGSTMDEGRHACRSRYLA